MAIALDIIKKKSWLDDTLAQQALDIKNSQWNDAFKAFVTKNKPVQPVSTTPIAPAPTPTPTPAPVAPAPVGTTTPSGATLTPEGNIVQPWQTAPVDKTPWITQTEFQKAQAESEKIKAQNEAVMAQNKQQADIKAQERKQIAEEQRIASIPTDQKGILNALVGGQTVAEQNTPEYRNALTISNQFKKFNGMTDVDLLNNLKQGQIGTELDWLLSQNPNYAKAKAELAKSQKTASINRATQIASNVISGKTNVIEDDLSGIEAKYNPPLGTNAQAYEAYVVNNPNVVTAGTQLKQLSTQISDVSKTYNDALKSIKSQYGDMPASALLTLMSSRTSDTKELLDSYINAKELAKGDFDMAMKMAEGGYEAYTRDIAVQQQIEAEQRQNQMNRENAVFQADLGLQTKQAEFEQGLAQQAQLASDPISGVQNIVDTFAKMGITADRSTQEMVQEVQSKMAQGMTVGEALSDIQQAFKSKPEYQKQMSLAMGQMSDYEKMNAQYQQQVAMQDRTFSQQLAMNDVNFNQDIQKMSMQYDMNDSQGRTEFKRDLIGKGMSETQADAIVRNETGDWNWVTGEKLLYADDGTFIKSTLKNTTNPNGWIECAEYISKMVGSRVGSTWEEKQKLNNETTGWIGSIAVWQPVKSGELAKYGHAGIIVGEDADNWYIKSANYNVDGRISTDPIPKSEVKNFRSTKLGEKMQGTGTQYTDSNIELLAELANMDASARNTALKAQGIPLSAVTDYMAQAKAWKIPPTESQKQSASQIISNIQDIASMDWNDATWFHWGTPSIAGTDRATAEAKINNLVSAMTLPNLGMLKWPMSDKDLAFIQSATSKLALAQSDSEFEKQLIELYNISARKAGLGEIKKLSEIPKEKITPWYQPQQQTTPTNTGAGQVDPLWIR